MQKFDASITAMRAICVAGIVLFHIEKSWFPLGYLGVDLFFVLSGYLITSAIYGQTKEGMFDIKTFYTRRFMRLMPALYFSIILTFIAAYSVGYHAVEFIELVESTLASLLFVSNFYFWQNTGYFVASANLMENIHHWSLSVEEQFYFIWPIVLVIFSKFFKLSHWIFVVLVALLAGVSVYLNIQYPTPAFYLLPTRTWQFLAGALLALHFETLRMQLRNLDKSIPLIGIFFVVLICGSFSTSVYLVQIITVAVSLLLLTYLAAGRTGPLVSLIQNNRLVMWLGLSSYSIYLVHQPVLAISRKVILHPLNQNWIFISCTVLAICFFGTLVYFVEKFFRYKKHLVLHTIAVHAVLIVLFSGLLIEQPKITINSAYADLAKFDYGCEVRNIYGCVVESGETNDQNRILLIGNSHARMLIPSFQAFGENFYLLHPDNLSRSLLGGSDDIAIQLTTSNSDKDKWAELICDMAQDFDAVVLAYRFNGYLYKMPNVHFGDPQVNNERLSQLRERLNTLANCTSQFIVLGQVPELDFWPRNFERAWQSTSDQKAATNRKTHETVSRPITELLTKITEQRQNVFIVWPEESLCDEDFCYSSKTDKNNIARSLYYDDDHLNQLGSRGLVTNILKLVKEN